jgi:undecaprenyl-diphosphatase|tara:strand:+ start:29318 stop:29662 length:345 start_codon:yes stop_codon:yes gene_type:complete
LIGRSVWRLANFVPNRVIKSSPFPTGFGDAKIIIASTVEVASWLLLRRWHLALGFVVSIAIASGIATLLKVAMSIPRPLALYEGAQVFGFPSGHATGAATLMGGPPTTVSSVWL